MRLILSTTLFLTLLAVPWLAALDGSIAPATAGLLTVAILAAAFLGASIFQAVQSLVFLYTWGTGAREQLGEHRAELGNRQAESIRTRYNLEGPEYTHKVLLALLLSTIAIITATAEIALVADAIFGRQVDGPTDEIGFLQDLQKVAYDYAGWLYALIMVCCFASAHLLHSWLELGNSESPEVRQRTIWAMRIGFVLFIFTALLFGLDWLLANHTGGDEPPAAELDMPIAPLTDVGSILGEMGLSDAGEFGLDELAPDPLPAESVYSGWAFSVGISVLRFAAIGMLAALMAPLAFLLGQVGPLMTAVYGLLISLARAVLWIFHQGVFVVYVGLHFLVGLPIRFVHLSAAPLAEITPAADDPADFREAFDRLVRRADATPAAGSGGEGKVREDQAPGDGPNAGNPDASDDDEHDPARRQGDASWSPFR